jgi:hypothetical protein
MRIQENPLIGVVLSVAASGVISVGATHPTRPTCGCLNVFEAKERPERTGQAVVRVIG